MNDFYNQHGDVALPDGEQDPPGFTQVAIGIPVTSTGPGPCASRPSSVPWPWAAERWRCSSWGDAGRDSAGGYRPPRAMAAADPTVTSAAATRISHAIG